MDLLELAFEKNSDVTVPVADLMPMGSGGIFMVAGVYALLVVVYIYTKKRQIPGSELGNKLEIVSQLNVDRKTRILEISTSRGSALLVLSDSGVSATPLPAGTPSQPEIKFADVLRKKRGEAA